MTDLKKKKKKSRLVSIVVGGKAREVNGHVFQAQENAKPISVSVH